MQLKSENIQMRWLGNFFLFDLKYISKASVLRILKVPISFQVLQLKDVDSQLDVNVSHFNWIEYVGMLLECLLELCKFIELYFWHIHKLLVELHIYSESKFCNM